MISVQKRSRGRGKILENAGLADKGTYLRDFLQKKRGA